MWHSEKILNRDLRSSSINDNHMNMKDECSVKSYNHTDTYSYTDVFKDVHRTNKHEFFATIRARMEAMSAAKSSDTPISFDDQYVNESSLISTKTSHFDYDEVCF